MIWLLALALISLLTDGEGHDTFLKLDEAEKELWAKPEVLRYETEIKELPDYLQHADVGLLGKPQEIITPIQQEQHGEHFKVEKEQKQPFGIPYPQPYSEIYENVSPKEDSHLKSGQDEFEGEPSTWSCYYVNCGGKRQSPINIDTEVIKIKPELGPLEFHNYDKPLHNLEIGNRHGQRIVVYIPPDENIFLSSKWFEGTYRLIEMVFFHSNLPKVGSLHAVDSKHHLMEILFVHLNTKYNDTRTNEEDVKITLSAFYTFSKEDNEVLTPIIDTFDRMSQPGQNTTINAPIKIKDYLPKHVDFYVTYSGSWLIPPCLENTRFIIFDYANKISKQQMEIFRTFKHITSVAPESKYRRPIQSLNNREIWGSFPVGVVKEEFHVFERSKLHQKEQQH